MKKRLYSNRQNGPPPPGWKRLYDAISAIRQLLSHSFNTTTHIMNTHLHQFISVGTKSALSVLVGFVMIASSVQAGHARVLFQDDDFHDIDSEGIIVNSNDGGDEDVTFQLGNDGSDAIFLFDDGTGDLSITTPGGDISFGDENLATTGNLDVNGNVLFNDSTQFRLREDPDPNTNADCATLNELILDTTDDEVQICTAVGTPGTWAAVSAGDADTLDNLDSADFLRSNASDSYTTGTLTTDAGTTVDVNGEFDGSGATEFHIRENSDPGTNSACTTVGEIILDTTDNEIQVCTVIGSPGTWVNVASGSVQDFESVYSADGDNTLTASGIFNLDATGAVDLDSDAGLTIGGTSIGLTADSGTLDLTGDGTNDINVSNTGAALDFDSATFDLTTTGAFAVSGGAASSISTSTGDLSITGGGDIVFDDGTITGTVTLGDADTDWDSDFAGNGILDNVNDIATQLGGDTISTFNFTEANVLADDDAIYAALEKLDLRHGDLASTANGEGASLIGIEDSGGNFTGTTVEAALTELAGSVSGNFETLTFEPEYENVVVFQDGSANRGRLDADYDSTNREHYYRWQTRQNSSNDIDLRFRFEVPADFGTGGAMGIEIFSDTNTLGDNSIAVTVRDDTADTTCHADAAQAASAATTWETLTITAGEINSCTLTPGDIVEVQLKLAADNTSSGGMQVGTIDYTYTK